MVALREAASRKEILDLANADDLLAAGLKQVEQCCSQRSKREIAAVLSAPERSWFAGERSSDNASDSVFTCKHTTCNFTDMIQFCKWDNILVSRYLEDAIGGGIEDGVAGTNVFLAEFFDDLCTRCRLVADHLAANRLFKRRYE